MKIKELEQKIQEEIWRLQMLDYPSPTAHDYLHKMQKELKALIMVYNAKCKKR